MKDHEGKDLFTVLRVSMACEECRKARKIETCDHVEIHTPEWKSKGKLGMATAMYGDNKVYLFRESMGIVADDDNLAFDVRALTEFFNREPYTWHGIDVNPRHVLIACDPGFTESDLSLVAVAYSHGNYVVCHRYVEHIATTNVAKLSMLFDLRRKYWTQLMKLRGRSVLNARANFLGSTRTFTGLSGMCMVG